MQLDHHPDREYRALPAADHVLRIGTGAASFLHNLRYIYFLRHVPEYRQTE
ncbi:hypothetical protein D3C73_1675470 [compost metagenome]